MYEDSTAAKLCVTPKSPLPPLLPPPPPSASPEINISHHHPNAMSNSPNAAPHPPSPDVTTSVLPPFPCFPHPYPLPSLSWLPRQQPWLLARSVSFGYSCVTAAPDEHRPVCANL